MQLLAPLLELFILASLTAAQTTTTTDAQGNTIVEVITTDPLGNPTTQILQTLAAGAAGAATTTTATVTDAAGASIVVVEAISTDVDGDTLTQTLQTLQTLQAAAGGPTTTTVVDGAGDTVVEVIANGATQTISTITDDSNPAGPGGGGGPVGQPATTPAQATAGAPTPYTYTTTNAAGDTIQVLATFTPSLATTVIPSQTFSATILNYSQYLASYATQIQTQQAAAGRTNAAGTLIWSGWTLLAAVSGLWVVLS
ncbi:Protein kinase domain-containing protein [Mycena chlorophos]|uniref:Protein kinase domain-containing protein n=1 Tax=Mycena chlorophos TaxID=658473 RepID=A0A8H6RVT0_MYCCL|nr:Protein kinase domain-containing protein [Mycena chlorophos]